MKQKIKDSLKEILFISDDGRVEIINEQKFKQMQKNIYFKISSKTIMINVVEEEEPYRDASNPPCDEWLFFINCIVDSSVTLVSIEDSKNIFKYYDNQEEIELLLEWWIKLGLK